MVDYSKNNYDCNIIKRISNKGISIVLRIILCIIIATLLLTLVYLIPTQKIDRNVGKSAHIFKEEGTFPILSKKIMSQYDNFTDAMILLEAANKNSNNPLKDAMSVKPASYDKTSYKDMIVNHYIYNKKVDFSHPYERYWHGHLVIIKPILFFIDYYGLRILNGIMMCITIILLIWQLFRKNEKLFIIPYILAMLFLMPATIAINIQFSNCYYVMSFGLLAIILLKSKIEEKGVEVFLYIGIATAFFDLLTYPIATFGVPCALYFFMGRHNSIKGTVKEFLKLATSWSLGYVIMWGSKWFLATIITGNNIIMDGIKQMGYRTNTGNTLALRTKVIIDTELHNIYCLLKTPATLLALIYLVIMIIMIIKIKKQNELSKYLFGVTPFILIAATPIAWYALATQHSNLHCWYTYKALVASMLSMLCIPTYLYKVIKND